MKAHWFWLVVAAVLFSPTACTSLLGNDFDVGPARINCVADPNACQNEHGSTACIDQTCSPVCVAGFDDCDGAPANGCETDVSTSDAHCGKCNLSCTAPHAATACRTGLCAVTACGPAWEDCNQDPVDGCETNIDADKTSCGLCGVQCVNAEGQTACTSGVCVPRCNPGWADCDNIPQNGCEADTSTSASHCGSCNNAVTAEETCSGGNPILASLCPSTNRDCNGNLKSDGCEVNVQMDRSHCGGCDNVCPTGTFCGAASCKSCTFFTEDFADLNSSWLVDPPWQVAAAQAGGGGPCTKPALQCGPPDPGTDQTASSDNRIAGIVLGGNYATASPGPFYLTSPSVDLRGAGSVTLEFWRWLSSDADPFIVNSVEAFNGETWKAVWTSPTGTTTPFLASEWTKFEYDLTPLKNADDAKNASFQVRFGFAVGRAGAFSYAGWNLDDVVIRSTSCGI